MYLFVFYFQARLTEVDGENECYKVQLKQKDQEIASLKKVSHTWKMELKLCSKF